MFLFQSPPSIYPLTGLIFGVEADEYVAFAEALGLRLEL